MAEDLVTVSVKMSRPLFARLQAYAREHRYSVSELLRDGVEWRLGESTDPLAYRYGAAEGNPSTGGVALLPEQERAAVERHQDIMAVLKAIRAHQQAQQPAHPLPAHVGTVIPVVPSVPVTPAGMVIPVIPDASVESVASVIPVVPTETVTPPETVIPVVPEAPVTGGVSTFTVTPPWYDADPTQFVWGKLCKRGHDYEGRGQSLRYKDTRECVQCKRGNSRASKAKARAVGA